ncbi:helix-turn-helix transcriptional regulator, partial [Roseisolibacter sp. H3M3-2]|uniref:helix-turn-helix domain-containing protein n=1 Tax=Roseisolibacter sp. H3M3-2 TaxID=3031323 RepID=UPI0023DBB038
GAPPAPAPADAWPDGGALAARFGLTARLAADARLLADGCSNGEVAARLGVSEHTARNHTLQVMAKLGAARRARIGPILRGAE